MPEHIDLDVSGILKRTMTIPQAGDALIESIVRTANGRLTASEALGHREFSMTKLYARREPARHRAARPDAVGESDFADLCALTRNEKSAAS